MKKYRTQYELMTTVPVPKLIMKLGIPTMISMFVTSIYNMADSYFVGRINTSASSATGVVLGLMAILQAMGFMFGHGSGSIISRKLGEKDIETAKKFSATGFYSALFSGFAILILGTIFLTPLMWLLGSTPTNIEYAKTYAICILCAAPALVSSCVMNNILRYEGRAFFAMIGLTSGGVLNIFLDAYFMEILNMGILGAGLATAISQCVSWALLLTMFVRKKTQTSLAFKYAKFDIKTLGNIITTGLPSLARQGLAAISTMLLNNAAGEYGDAAIAAMSITNRISMFIFSAVLGIGQGFQPIAGFNFGAKKYSRVKKAFFFTLIFGTILMGTAAELVYFNAGSCIWFFRNDMEVVNIGIPALQAQCLAMLIVPFQVCNNMLFQSIGYKFNATFLSSLRNGLYFIPILLILSVVLGLQGIQLSQPIADVMTSLTCIPFTISFFAKLPKKDPEETEGPRSKKMADGKSYNSKARKKDGTTSSPFYKLVFFLVKVVFGTKPVPHIEPGDFDNAESPYIMLSNHESFTDFCYLYRLASKDKPLFVVNRLYTLMPFLSFLSRRIGMIPKKVFYDDPNASVKIMRTLKRGTPVIIFPEGRLCIDGRSNAIPEPGGAFYKRLGVDIVLVQISGAFYEKPKWRKKRYRTPVNITVKRVLKKDEIAKMSAEEIGNIIVDTISHKAPDEAFTTYPQKDKAEGLHNILYRCYSCDGLYTTRSGGNRITCDKCGKTFELGDDYRFKSEPYTIANWYDHITEIERKNIREIDLKADVTAKIRSKNGKVRKEHGRARLTFDEFTYESENVSVRYKTENMNAMLFTAGDHFEIYHNDEMYFLCPDEQPQQSARWAHAVDIMCALRKESQRTVKE